MEELKDDIEGNVENNKCSECGHDNYYYCKPCNSVHFRVNFAHWTSGDSKLDKLIQNSQLNADNSWELIEWIEYSNLEIINDVGQGGFGNVYKAVWKDGPIDRYKQAWNVYKSEFQRRNKMEVALKKLKNATFISSEFLNEVNNLNNISIKLGNEYSHNM
jgi:serine/threonine protein kinase